MSNSSTSLIVLFGRILLSIVFILSGITKITSFSMEQGYAVSRHLPLPAVAVVVALVIEILGGLAILTGFFARLAAWIVFLYLIPTTFLFHNFWAMSGTDRYDNMAHFEKNLAIMGGLLVLAAVGSGAYSIDAAQAPKAT